MGAVERTQKPLSTSGGGTTSQWRAPFELPSALRGACSRPRGGAAGRPLHRGGAWRRGRRLVSPRRGGGRAGHLDLPDHPPLRRRRADLHHERLHQLRVGPEEQLFGRAGDVHPGDGPGDDLVHRERSARPGGGAERTARGRGAGVAAPHPPHLVRAGSLLRPLLRLRRAGQAPRALRVVHRRPYPCVPLPAGGNCARPAGEGPIKRFAMARPSKRRRADATAGGSAPSGTPSSARPASSPSRPPGSTRPASSTPSRYRTQRVEVPRPWWQAPWAWGGAVTVVVVAVLVVFIVLGTRPAAKSTSPSSSNPLAPASVLAAVTGVSPSVSSTIAAGVGATTFGGAAGATACAQQFQSNVHSLNIERLQSITVDWSATNLDALKFRWKQDRGVQATATDPINSAFSANSVQPEWDAQVNWTHTINSGMLNQFIASAMHYV